MNTNESAASKGAAISPKKNTRNEEPNNKVLILQIVMISVIDILVALLIFAVAKMVCKGVADDVFASYFKVLFIPLVSFLTAFASFVFTKNFKVSSVINIILSLTLFFISNGFEWAVLLWEILYAVNALLGFIIAFAVRSYKA